jgi:DNA-binding beta-propeller fold protein YncE
VADTGNSRIAIFAVDGNGGTLVGAISGGARRPEGVDLHPDGRVLATGSSSGNLVAYREGEVVAQVGGFSSPHDVAVDASGNIWVADAGNDRVVKLSADLEPLLELSGEPYGFNGPRYLDFDAEGRLFVADKYTHSIKILGPDGEMLQVLGTGRAGEGTGAFDRPEGVEIRGRDIWFSDTYNDRIVRYRMSPATDG